MADKWAPKKSTNARVADQARKSTRGDLDGRVSRSTPVKMPNPEKTPTSVSGADILVALTEIFNNSESTSVTNTLIQNFMNSLVQEFVNYLEDNSVTNNNNVRNFIENIMEEFTNYIINYGGGNTVNNFLSSMDFKVYVQPGEPSDPSVGTLWFDTDDTYTEPAPGGGE